MYFNVLFSNGLGDETVSETEGHGITMTSAFFENFYLNCDSHFVSTQHGERSADRERSDINVLTSFQLLKTLKILYFMELVGRAHFPGK